ncbi:MAG: CPBP family intramembrane metalloprotease [Bacteroidales bacterium]|nr:CPBP family intramembrane metalloprotease [Bacteroidales bacterium]
MKSDRKKWIELISVAITGLLKFVIMDWLQMRAFYICGACLSWLIYVIVKYKSDNTILIYWGFKKENFRVSFLFLLPFTLLSILVFIIYGLSNHLFIPNWHIIPVFVLYPIWGLIQQFMMAGILAGNLISIRNIHFKNYQVILLTSLIFSMVHYPSFFLMIFAFIMQLIFTAVYLKWRNLWTLGLIHGWVGTFLIFCVLKRDLWIELFAWF